MKIFERNKDRLYYQETGGKRNFEISYQKIPDCQGAQE